MAHNSHALDLAAFHAIVRKARNECKLQAAHHRLASQFRHREKLVVVPVDSVKRGHMPGRDTGVDLAGHTRARGLFEDRFGRLRRRFEVEMHGAWKGGLFVLDESLRYDDGTLETRTWMVTPTAGGRFTATCPDCLGLAHGTCSEGMVRTLYRFRLQLQSRVVIVDFDDRLYRIDDDFAVNRATMRKWGIRLGELTLFFERVPDAAGAPHGPKGAA